MMARGEQADSEHDESPDWGCVDHGCSAIEGAEDDAGDGVGLAGERGHGQSRGHSRLHEARADAHYAHATIAVREAEAVEEGGQASLGGAVKEVAAPRPVAGHRAERADRAAAAARPTARPSAGRGRTVAVKLTSRRWRRRAVIPSRALPAPRNRRPSPRVRPRPHRLVRGVERRGEAGQCHPGRDAPWPRAPAPRGP